MKPRTERNKTETKVEKRAETRTSPLGVGRPAVQRLIRALGELFISQRRISISALNIGRILDPSQLVIPLWL